MRGIDAGSAATAGSRRMRRAILAFAVVATVLAGLLGMHVLELHGTSAAGHDAGATMTTHSEAGVTTHAGAASADGAASPSEMGGMGGMGDSGMAMGCVLALLLAALAVRLRRRSVLRTAARPVGGARCRSLRLLLARIPDPPTPLLLGISRT